MSSDGSTEISPSASALPAPENGAAPAATPHRGARSLVTFASGLVYTLVTVLLGFIATPLLVRWLGDTRYGAYRAAQDWFGHLTLLDLGLGGALAPLLAVTLARRREKLPLVLRTAVYAYARVAGLMLLASLPLALLMPHLVRVGPALRHDLILGSLLGMAGALLLPLYPYRQLLEAAQHGYWINFFLLAQALFTVGLALVLARAGWGIAGQFAALTAGVLLSSLAFAWRARKILPIPAWGRPDPTTLAQLRRQQWPAWILSLSGRVQLLSDNMIVAALLSPAAVVPFFITQKLTALGQREAQRLSGASWPALAEMHARGELPLFRRRLLELTRLTSVAGCLLMLPVALFNREFITAWMGARYYAGFSLTLFAALNAVLQSLLTVWQYCLDSTGEMRRVVPLAAAQGTLNLAASLLLTWRLGMIGPVLGTTVAFAGIGLWRFPVLLRRSFQVSPFRLLWALILPAGLALLVGLPGWLWARQFPPLGILASLLHMAAIACVYGLLAWFLAFNREMRRDQARWLAAATARLRPWRSNH